MLTFQSWTLPKQTLDRAYTLWGRSRAAGARYQGLYLMLMKKLVAGAATTVLALSAISGLAHAQEITGGINGEITDDAGHPLAGVKVQVTYAPTHTTLTATTSKEGYFSVRNLQVGGPYSVTASDATHPAKSLQVEQITIGTPYELDFSLEGGGVQEVTVKATRIQATSQVQTGPPLHFHRYGYSNPADLLARSEGHGAAESLRDYRSDQFQRPDHRRQQPAPQHHLRGRRETVGRFRPERQRLSHPALADLARRGEGVQRRNRAL